MDYLSDLCFLWYHLAPFATSLSSLCAGLRVHSHYLLWRLLFYEPWPEKVPPLRALYAAALLMVFLMAADGRREPLAPGPGVLRSFNKSQSVLCRYINTFGQLL